MLPLYITQTDKVREVLYMNENTLNERIKEIEEKLTTSYDPLEQAELSEQLKEYKIQLANLQNGHKKREIKLKTHINAPIIGDRDPYNNPNNRRTIYSEGNGSFILRM